MAFIRTRKIKYDENNKIISGTAAIIESKYVSGNLKYHSKQIVRERLGKVIELYSKKEGLFLSPTRGLVIYNSKTDTFSDPVTREQAKTIISNQMVQEKTFPTENIHTIFGDSFLFFEIMNKVGITNVLSNIFSDITKKQRLFCHILHDILKDGSHIACDDFVQKSFVSYCAKDVPVNSLKSDTAFFAMMADDRVKLSFFRSFVKFMKKKNPDFGDACFVDSTPLPNDINTPFNALCSHGIGSATTQMRLVLILDESTLMPIWYDIIPGNIQDVNTLKYLTKDVEISLGINLNGFYLDAGYASKRLIQSFKIQKENETIPKKKYLVRMPARNGYPYKELYKQIKEDISKADYDFVRKNHSYFGKMVPIKIFETDVIAYVYLDQYNALKGYTEYITNHADDFEKLSLEEKNWLKVKFGFFVLISNYRKTPAEILDDYFCRASIESTFKTDKEYLKLLPLCKWTDTTVRGKILTDIISSIIRQQLQETIKGSPWSIPSVIGKCQSLMCCIDSKNDIVYIEHPNKQVKEIYKLCNITIPEKINLTPYLKQIYNI